MDIRFAHSGASCVVSGVFVYKWLVKRANELDEPEAGVGGFGKRARFEGYCYMRRDFLCLYHCRFRGGHVIYNAGKREGGATTKVMLGGARMHKELKIPVVIAECSTLMPDSRLDEVYLPEYQRHTILAEPLQTGHKLERRRGASLWLQFIYTNMNTYIYIYIHVHIYIYICICLCMCTIYTYAYICMLT